MRNIRKTIELTFRSQSELSEVEKLLFHRAVKSAETAYAPYSNFKVGAAILLSNGDIVSGNNQENAAYPSGLCAERTAMFSASAVNPGISMKKIAVYSPSMGDDDAIAFPCGACRQVMAEYERKQNENLEVLLFNRLGECWVALNTEVLLPFQFNF